MRRIKNTGVVPTTILEKENKKLEKRKIPKEREQSKREAEETLDAMGSQNHKVGVDSTIEVVDKWNKEERNLKLDRITYLQSRRRNSQEYYETLAAFVFYGLKFLEWPIGWHWTVEINELGVKSSFTTRFGQKYARAFKPSGEPRFDEQACRNLVGSADDTILKLVNSDEKRKTKNGIYLPV